MSDTIDKIISNGRGQLKAARQLLSNEGFDINELFQFICAAENCFDDVEIHTRKQLKKIDNQKKALVRQDLKFYNLVNHCDKVEKARDSWREKFEAVKWIVDENIRAQKQAEQSSNDMGVE